MRSTFSTNTPNLHQATARTRFQPPREAHGSEASIATTQAGPAGGRTEAESLEDLSQMSEEQLFEKIAEWKEGNDDEQVKKTTQLKKDFVKTAHALWEEEQRLHNKREAELLAAQEKNSAKRLQASQQLVLQQRIDRMQASAVVIDSLFVVHVGLFPLPSRLISSPSWCRT